MKNVVIILSSILISYGCQTKVEEKPNIEGDLYYKWLKLGSFYDLPDSVYQNYIDLRDSIGIEEMRIQDSSLTSTIELLEKHNLLKSPYIFLKTDEDSTFIIYMSLEDYKPITEYTYQDLIDKKQKIRLVLKTERLTDQLLLCKKVISMKKIDGETLMKQKKIKIEDYR